MKFRKSTPIVGLLAVLGGVGGGMATPSVRADNRCREVRARVVTTITTENCTSATGLCSTGHLIGGPFDGMTAFLTAGIAPSAGMPGVEPAANLSYSGTFTMTSPRGTLVTSDLGVLDASHAKFVEMMRTESGTGRFSNPTGTLFITGSLLNNETEFDGIVTGQLCTDADDGDND